MPHHQEPHHQEEITERRWQFGLRWKCGVAGPRAQSPEDGPSGSAYGSNLSSRFLIAALLIAILWTASFPIVAQQRPLYRIAGKIVDSHTGAALGHCSVQIAAVKNQDRPQTFVSGEDGSFAFAGLSQGKYSLSAERRGYLDQAYEEHEPYSTAIAVGPGLESENLLFRLTAEAIISGTITDEAGEAVRGAQVRLFADEDNTGIRATRQRHTVITDDRGIYEIPNLRPGAYFLVVTAHPWYSQRLQRMRLGEQNEESSDVQALDVGYPNTFYPGATDQDGATPIPVKGGDRLEINLTLTPQPAMRLHLSLPATPGEPNRGPSVALTQSLFGQNEDLPVQMNYRPDGSVELDGILPGHYDVALTRFDNGNATTSGSKHFQADIGAGNTELSEDSGINDVTVAGKVISEAGKLPPNAGISLRTPNGRRQQYGTLNDAGEFTVEVPAGTYEVVGNINGMHISSLRASGAAVAGRMVIVKTGAAPKLEIVTGTGHGEIEGIVMHGEKPASAVMVLLVPEDPKNNEILFRRDQSDSDGTFDLLNIFPGRYRMLAIADGWELEWGSPAVLEAFLAKSVPIEVKSGDHLTGQKIQVQQR